MPPPLEDQAVSLAIVPPAESVSDVPPTDRTYGDELGHSAPPPLAVLVPLSPLEATKVTVPSYCWKKASYWLTWLAVRSLSLSPQLIETTLAP